MIINQSIRNGFVTVNKTGAYFSLISAGGLVTVRLSEKGRTVLDTKMWVGMSINEAIPFDEITLLGDDGAVEFWAGDVSMYSSRFANNAAKAIRTSVHLVDGEVAVAGSDLTRSAVRVRSDKEVFVGGTGFQSGGWRVAAGETIEVPLAGVISAYKREAFLDYSAPKALENEAAFFDANVFPDACVYVSGNEQTRIYNTSATGGLLRCTTDGGVTWKTIFDDVYCYEFDKRTGIHYVLQLVGVSGLAKAVVFNRSYDGIEWETMYRRYHEWPDGAGLSAVSYRGHIVNGWFQRTYQGMSICCNIETGQVVVKAVKVNGLNARQGAWLDTDLQVGIFGISNELFKTEDGGVTWRSVLADYYNATFAAAGDGIHLFASANTRPHISEDGGETWVQVGSSSWSSRIGVHVKDNLWIANYSYSIRYVDMPNGMGSQVSGTLIAAAGYSFNHVFIRSNGEIYFPSDASLCKTGISVIGDLSAARVEVMELLS